MALAPGVLACDDLFPKGEEGAAGAPADDDDDACNSSVARFTGHWGRTCAQLQACYPDEQLSGGTSCRAPAVEGRLLYPKPRADELRLVEQCLGAYADKDELETWLCCQDVASEAELECYRSCPEYGNDCAENANAQLERCNQAFDGNAQLTACFGGD